MFNIKIKKGFTFVELLLALLIIGALTLIGFFAASAAISSANKTRVQSDFQELESECTLILLENPGVLKATGYQPKAVLSYFTNDSSPLAVDLAHCGSDEELRNGGSDIESIRELNSKSVVGISSTDPWGTPYKIYIQANDLEATGDDKGDAEVRVFIISNGENKQGSDKPNLLDSDDICMLIEDINGKISVGYYNLDPSLEQICWLSKDAKNIADVILNTKDPNVILNMNYACLKPVEDNE